MIPSLLNIPKYLKVCLMWCFVCFFTRFVCLFWCFWALPFCCVQKNKKKIGKEINKIKYGWKWGIDESKEFSAVWIWACVVRATQINTVRGKSRFNDYRRTLTSLQLLSNLCRWDRLVWVPQPHNPTSTSSSSTSTAPAQRSVNDPDSSLQASVSGERIFGRRPAGPEGSHAGGTQPRRRLGHGTVQLWGKCAGTSRRPRVKKSNVTTMNTLKREYNMNITFIKIGLTKRHKVEPSPKESSSYKKRHLNSLCLYISEGAGKKV